MIFRRAFPLLLSLLILASLFRGNECTEIKSTMSEATSNTLSNPSPVAAIYRKGENDDILRPKKGGQFASRLRATGKRFTLKHIFRKRRKASKDEYVAGGEGEGEEEDFDPNGEVLIRNIREAFSRTTGEASSYKAWCRIFAATPSIATLTSNHEEKTGKEIMDEILSKAPRLYLFIRQKVIRSFDLVMHMNFGLDYSSEHIRALGSEAESQSYAKFHTSRQAMHSKKFLVRLQTAKKGFYASVPGRWLRRWVDRILFKIHDRSLVILNEALDHYQQEFIDDNANYMWDLIQHDRVGWFLGKGGRSHKVVGKGEKLAAFMRKWIQTFGTFVYSKLSRSYRWLARNMLPRGVVTDKTTRGGFLRFILPGTVKKIRRVMRTAIWDGILIIATLLTPKSFFGITTDVTSPKFKKMKKKNMDELVRNDGDFFEPFLLNAD